MPLTIQTWLAYDFAEPTDVLLQIEAALLPDQRVLNPAIGISPVEHFARVPGHDEIGERIWLRVGPGRLMVDYAAVVEINRTVMAIDQQVGRRCNLRRCRAQSQQARWLCLLRCRRPWRRQRRSC